MTEEPEMATIEDRIAESTLHLLRTGGPRAVNVEAVADHSGIAKTTIYRRHPDRRDMLATALSRVVIPPPPEFGTSAADRLRWIIEHAIDPVDHGIGLGGRAALLLTDDDPAFTELFRRILADQRAPLIAAVEAGRADGSMRADLDAATLIDAIVGSYLAEYSRTGARAEDWRQRLFTLFWPTVRAAG